MGQTLPESEDTVKGLCRDVRGAPLARLGSHEHRGIALKPSFGTKNKFL